MDLEERRRLIRASEIRGYQRPEHSEQKIIHDMLNEFHNNKEKIERYYIENKRLPSIADDWIAIAEGIENKYEMLQHVYYQNSGKEFRYTTFDQNSRSVPYFPNIVDMHQKRRYEMQQEIINKAAEAFSKDVEYVTDALLLGYNDVQIKETADMEDAYFHMCLFMAKKNKIRRHIQIEKMKANGQYAIADAIHEAGKNIRSGLDSIAFWLYHGFQSLSESNYHIAESLDRNAQAGESVAAAIRELYEPLSASAYASLKYTNLQEHIYKAAKEAELTPAVCGDMLLVNSISGVATKVSGTAYRKNDCYIVYTDEGVMFLPANNFVLYGGTGNIDYFRNELYKITHGQKTTNQTIYL